MLPLSLKNPRCSFRVFLVKKVQMVQLQIFLQALTKMITAKMEFRPLMDYGDK